MADVISSSFGICLCHIPRLLHLSSLRPRLMYLPCQKPRLRYMPCHKSWLMRLSMSQAQTMASIYVISPEYGICLCYKPSLLHLSMSQTRLCHLQRQIQSTAAGYVIIPYYCICLCHKSRIWHLPKSQAWIWHLPMLQIQIILPAYMSQTQTIASAYVTSAGYDVFLSHGPRIFFLPYHNPGQCTCLC